MTTAMNCSLAKDAGGRKNPDKKQKKINRKKIFIWSRCMEYIPLETTKAW